MSATLELTEREPSFDEKMAAWKDNYSNPAGGLITGGTLVRGLPFGISEYLNSHGPYDGDGINYRLVSAYQDDKPTYGLQFSSLNHVLHLRYNKKLVWRAPITEPPPGLGLICEWPRQKIEEDSSED